MDRLPLYLKIKNELDIVKLKKLEFCKLLFRLWQLHLINSQVFGDSY